MTDDEKRAYSKGYYAGASGRWPVHRTPSPPDPLVRQLLKALTRLYTAVDAELATFSEEDELVRQLAPPMDEAAAALEALQQWLRRRET